MSLLPPRVDPDAVEEIPPWHERWMAVLDALNASIYRRERGRQAVRRGDVTDLSVDAGSATARVQAAGKRAFRPTLRFTPFPDDVWTAVTAELATEVRHGAALLSGNLPDDLDDLLSKHDVAVVPVKGQVEVDCTCPESADLCNHVTALISAIGREVERDPFMLLALRGRERARLLAALRAARAGTDEPSPIDRTIVAIDALDPAMLRHAVGDLDAIAVHPSSDHDPTALLRSLGLAPGMDDDDQLATLVRSAAGTAWKLAAGAGSEEADREVLLAELRARRMATAGQLTDALSWERETVDGALEALYDEGAVMRTGTDDSAKFRAK